MKSKETVLASIRVTDRHFKLADFTTRLADGFERDALSEESLEAIIKEISNLQNKLYAEDRQSLLIIFQGMDSSGKDGTIKNIMKGINPQGVLVTSFKHPCLQELAHDFLWRHMVKLPEHGQIMIFNRSHYENVLISKVHPELVLAEHLKGYDNVSKIDNSFWKSRYDQINNFEKGIIETGTQLLKFFLHISKEEQGSRFLKRIDNEEKHWKFSSADIEERKYWGQYQAAYEQAIQNTSTPIAPWFVLPADDKSITHILIGKIILDKLLEMNPVFPVKTAQEMAFMQQAKANLEHALQ